MPGDVSVALNPTSYSSGSSCVGVKQTEPRTVVPSDCATQWLAMDSAYVAGQDLMTAGYPAGTPMPKRATVSSAISPSVGAADATAYFRTTAFSEWALQYTDQAVVSTIDTLHYANRDPILALWNQAAYIAQPPACGYPTSFRVAATDSATQEYLGEQGWSQASKTAVIATFPACPGVDVTIRQGNGVTTTTKKFGQANSGSAIVTGFVENIGPFGDLWVVDGYEACGPSQLKALCG